MKKTLMFCAAIMLVSTCSSSFGLNINSPYIGVESIYASQKFEKGYGSDVFKSTYDGINIFAGTKFNENFGIELGYEYQPVVVEFSDLREGDYIPGNILLAGDDFVEFIGDYESFSPYLGLFGESKPYRLIGMNFTLKALLGVSSTRILASTIYVRDNDGYHFIRRNYSKTKIVPIVRLSVISYISDNFGFGVTLNYRNMSQFKVYSNESTGSMIKFKDNYSYGLSIAYYF